MQTKQNNIIVGSLVTITALSTAILTLPSALADDGFVDVVTVTVPVSCSLGASGMDTHTASIQNGVTTENIGTTNIKVTCNDNTGYALYAIGYTNNEYGNNKLTSATLDSTYDILTSTSTSNTSSWAMKLTKTTNDYTPIISGSLDDNNKQTGDPDFSDYSAVPNEYTKVAYALSSTDIGANASGSNLTTTYRAYISQTQPAGTYIGQVKYTLVHPNTAGAPLVCNPTGTTIGTNSSTDIKCMQDISSTNKSAILTSMTQNTQYTLADSRDEKNYTVAKLADGNIWMTQNLDHDIDSTYNYNSTNTDVPANWNDTLTSTYATDTTTWNNSYFNSYFAPESYDPGDLCWNGIIRNDYNGTLANDTVPCGNDKHYHIGNYYNWTAAVAMADSSSYTANNTDVDQSICPAGWMLPKSGTILTGSGSFAYLVNQLSLTSGVSGNIQNSPVYFTYATIVGSIGRYWSSVAGSVSDGNEYNAYFLDFEWHNGLYQTPNYPHPQSLVTRGGVFTLRCVAR